ncbi:MAG TPA: dTDP-4-dehydrorhamnose reductase [Polyangiaceae bacterium]|nr:dTDP-4-dehydrorhamnose reductase [Polyangiaceae bacterium]
MAERPLLITGASGTLGRAFMRVCEARGLPYVATTRARLDLSNPDAVERTVEEEAPWAVVNAAGYVRVDDAEADAEACFAANALGPARLAAACARHKARLATFSTDLVFDGRKREPYLEADAPAPLNAYGRSKAKAERLVASALPGALVVRTSAFFGPWDTANFVTHALRALSAGETFFALADSVVSPTYVVDLAHATLDLLLAGEGGIVHLANRGACGWPDLARQAADLAGVPGGRVEPRPARELGLRAPRPAYSALGSRRAPPLPSLRDALTRYLQERETA